MGSWGSSTSKAAEIDPRSLKGLKQQGILGRVREEILTQLGVRGGNGVAQGRSGRWNRGISWTKSSVGIWAFGSENLSDTVALQWREEI